MSTRFATSPDSGHSVPRTTPRGQAKPTKSSPVRKVYPNNREQYQKFGYDDSFLLPAFDDKSKFFNFLGVNPLGPELTVPDMPLRGMKYFLTLANEVAEFIKDEHFPECETLVFKDTGNQRPLGHVTDTAACKPDFTAALTSHWKHDRVHWPFIRLAGETASEGKSHHEHIVQAISYLHCLLLARPDLFVAQGLLSSKKEVVFLFGIGGKGVRPFHVEWEDEDLHKFLYAFIYRLYEPGHFADPSYINTKFDEKTTAKYTINITHGEGKIVCHDFYPIYARNPFATRTHVLSNPNFKAKGNDLTILKDQFSRVNRHFDDSELTILDKHVHNPERVPGVVVAAYGETIKLPLKGERCKHRLGLGESGSHFISIPTLSKVLETLFDVLEVLRYLRLHRNVLHRDISSGNVLYVENSSNCSLPPNAAQEAKTNGLCYAKYLLGKSKDRLETSMLLVDFNLAEHLEAKTNVKDRAPRTGTPLFIARAVELGGPVPSIFAPVPEIPEIPGRYKEVHPDRDEGFPKQAIAELVINPRKPFADIGSPGEWRHELDHDAESVFWLHFYWAMVVQPDELPEEMIDPGSWSELNGNYESRQKLIGSLMVIIPANVIHSHYKPLQPLVRALAAILVVDSRWLPASDPRKNPFYITEAFQRLILKFMIDNRDKKFMDRRVQKTFRKVKGAQDYHALSFTDSQKLDARTGVDADDVEMDDIDDGQSADIDDDELVDIQ